MTEREKFIELFSPFADGTYNGSGTIVDGTKVEDVVDSLLANGVIVSPIKLGDKVYIIYGIKTAHKRIVKIEVSDIEIDFRYSFSGSNKIYRYNYNSFTNDDIGKTVFLTKEEAEEKLKELEDNA